VKRVLHTGELVPHFEVTDFAGQHVRYASFWQRKNLVLVTLPDGETAASDYAIRLSALVDTLDDDNTKWIVTCDRVEGVPHPSVVVADQWGEVAHVAHPSRVDNLPGPDELLEWVQHLECRCPECEGEAR